MSFTSLRRPLLRQTLWICESCASRAHLKKPGRRWKTAKASKASPLNVVEILEQRGYLNQITGTRDELANILTSKRVGAYVGIDPTASSMHVGHLIPFMALFWLYLHGHKAITLVGGGTASVGDPTGRVKARPHLAKEERRQNIHGIEAQLQRIWGNVSALGKKHQQGSLGGESKLLNNEEWLARSSILDVLSTIGAGLRLGAMMGRDTVKTRMTDASQQGMSFSEFCYPVLQAWDWWIMFRDHDVSMQIGGSDQYGNILSGVDGIKYALKIQEDVKEDLPVPLGFTVPLLTTPSGEKFGKSAGNAIWLDKGLTSVFDLYGFFVGTPDSEVLKLLHFFTFLPQETIEKAIYEHNKTPEKRIAQHLLAREFVELVHGPEEAQAAYNQHTSRSSAYTHPDAGILPSDLKLPSDQVVGEPFAALLKTAGLAESKAQAMRLIESGGAYVNRGPPKGLVKIEEKNQKVGADDLLIPDKSDKVYLMLRVGKWKSRTIEIERYQ